MNEMRMTDPAQVQEFLLGGNAYFTLRSKRTGNRFTYRARSSEDGTAYFISVLTGSDNESSYSFLGTIFDRGHNGFNYTNYRYSNKSRIGIDADSAKAFEWFYKNLQVSKLGTELEVWHEGRCGRCGRTLTVPESIKLGLGPECARKNGVYAPTLDQNGDVPF